MNIQVIIAGIVGIGIGFFVGSLLSENMELFKAGYKKGWQDGHSTLHQEEDITDGNKD